MKLKKILNRSNLAFLMIVMLLFGIFGDMANQMVIASGKDRTIETDSTADSEAVQIDYAEPKGVYTLTFQDIINRFNTTESFVLEQQNEGFSLNDIYDIFFKAEEQKIGYEESRLKLYPSEINNSPTVTTEVYSELPDPLFRDVPIIEMDTVTEDVYSEEVIEDIIEDTIDDEPGLITDSDDSSVEKGSTVSEDVYAGKAKMFSAMARENTPVIEKAPVYNKTSFNEAPYTLGINNESVSSLSGGLSLHNDDLTLPGRNGLSFTLTRSYDTNSAQFYGMNYGYNVFPYDYYEWGVQYDALKKPLVTKYDVYMREYVRTEYDFDRNGVTDSVSSSTELPARMVGSYDTEEAARQLVNQIPNTTYTVNSDTVEVTSSSTNSSNSFNSYILYNANGYSGTLYTTGSSYQSGGSYTPAQYTTGSGSCQNNISGIYNKGVWTPTSSGTACPTTYYYSANGYTGNLPRTSTDTLKECPSPTSKTTNGVCTKMYVANYSGTVTKPASADTRIYTQDYRGRVTRPSYTSNERYEDWIADGNSRIRKIYSRYGAPWVQQHTEEGTVGSIVQLRGTTFEQYTEASAYQNYLNTMGNTFIGSDGSANYYVASWPNAQTYSFKAGTRNGVEYYNSTVKSKVDTMYPIGKGWSWKLPYVDIEDGKSIVHLTDGGSYEVENSTLKGYEWQGVTFTADSSVTVNGEASQYVLTSENGKQKQFFTKDGQILQISDAYNNSVQFQYEYNSYYGTELLSLIRDAIGNTININYTASAVTLSKGSQTVVYNKHSQDGVELLDSVKDIGGRITTYNYQIKAAQFNLFSSYAERAVSNPYALLSKVQYPTGASTEYTYETQPVRRYNGEYSFNEAYRLSSRNDVITYENGITKEYNRHSLFYNNSDMGASPNQDIEFSTTINDGLTNTTFNYKRDYIDSGTPSQFYLESSVQSAEGTEKYMNYTYGKYVGTRTYPAVVPTGVTASTNKASDVLTTSSKYDDYGNITESVDAKGRTTTYTFDSKHLLQTVMSPANTGVARYTGYTRNEQGSITQVVIRKDNAYGEILQQLNFNNFDVYGNASEQSILNGSKTITTTTAFDNNHAFPVSQKVMVSDVNHQESQIVTGSTFDPLTGLQTSYTNGNRNQTDYSYDSLGRILKVAHPDGGTLSVVYDDINNTVTVTDEAGSVSVTKWNALGMEIETGLLEKEGYKKKTSTAYDGYGRAEWSQDATGNKTQYKYDAWSRLTTLIHPDMTENTTLYNETQHTNTVIDSENYKTIETYDKWGQLIKKEEQATPSSAVNILQSIVYNNGNDQIAELLDANGNKTSYEYDYTGNLVSVTDGSGELTRYTYDMQGNQLSTVYPDGQIKKASYDELGRVLTTTDELGLIEQFSYDANGNLLTSQDRNGDIQTFSYDKLDRLKENVASDETVSFTYDTAGKRRSMTDGTGTTRYNYDSYTGFLTEVQYADGLTLEVTEYDAKGNRKRMVGPFGKTTEYKYNINSQLESVGTNAEQPITNYSYYKNGLLLQAASENGVNNSYHYTGVDLKSVVHTKIGNVLNQYNYQYDPNKNIKSIARNGQSAMDKDFTYDQVNRIKAATGDAAGSYSYDTRGNRITQESANDSLISLSNLQDTEYTYDKRNRLKEVKLGGKTVQYEYNGDGLLINRTENGLTTRYYYDGDQIIAEANVVNDIPQEVASYIRGQRLEAVVYNDGTKAYPLYNGHGDIVELRDAQGEILNRYDYDIWGNITLKEEQVHNPFRYSGELWDETTGLQYLRARWYDPSTGRFITEDSYTGQLDNPLSLNLYTYVLNNPLRFIDPSGNMATEPFEVHQLRLLLQDARGKTWGSKANSNYQLYKGFIWDRYNFASFMDTNTYNYLYGLVTGTSAYKNGAGKADWATGQLVNAYYESVEAEYVAAVAMGAAVGVSMRGSSVSSNKTKGGCNCFVAGTKVQTDEGEKNIEDIEVGDKVLSKDEETGEVAYKEVVYTFHHNTNEIYKIHVGGQTIEATFNHPFYVMGKGWLFVKELKVGDLLVQSNGNTLKIGNIELERKPVTVYNMTVDEFHTYFVSNLGIWVHNSECSLTISKTAARVAKKLSPEAKKGYEAAIKGLESGDLRGLNAHPLSGNRKGQWAVDIKGSGGAVGMQG